MLALHTLIKQNNNHLKNLGGWQANFFIYNCNNTISYADYGWLFMEIRQIYYVLEVAKQKSFSGAAKALYVTQPAISHQINALEEELQVKLFKRDTHSVSLTSDGEKFCEYAQKIVDSVDDLFQAFDLELSDEKPVLRVGVYPFYGKSPLRQILASFFATNSNVMGNIKAVDNYAAYDMLRNGDLDFAIIKCRRDNMPDFDYTEIDDERLYAVISRKRTGVNANIMILSDLGNYPLLTGEKDSHFYIEMKKLYSENNIPFNVSFMNTSETSLMQDMVRDDVGIILATESTARSLEDSEITALPIEPKQELVTLIIYPNKKKLRGAYLAFRNYVTDAYKMSPESDTIIE